MASFVIPAAQAMAALGEHIDSVQSDAVAMGAKAAVVSNELSAYTVQSMTTEDGVDVREFVTPDGTVFGVAWRGPHAPDLAQLLGKYFRTYTDEAAKAKGPRSLHYGSVKTADLVVQRAGQARETWGRAYVPALVPSAVSEDEIK
ncbi:MAG TPA: DUF2844 domain-containing protein [Candidatus Binataceae bacterium]|nr:DUF2844 domain-containing protein [Candidatus Binataceae bacterium]